MAIWVPNWLGPYIVIKVCDEFRKCDSEAMCQPMPGCQFAVARSVEQIEDGIATQSAARGQYVEGERRVGLSNPSCGSPQRI